MTRVTVNGLPCDECGGAVRHVPSCRRNYAEPPAPPTKADKLRVLLTKLVKVFHELDAELDGVELPLSAAAAANSIRRTLAQIKDVTDES